MRAAAVSWLKVMSSMRRWPASRARVSAASTSRGPKPCPRASGRSRKCPSRARPAPSSASVIEPAGVPPDARIQSPSPAAGQPRRVSSPSRLATIASKLRSSPYSLAYRSPCILMTAPTSPGRGSSRICTRVMLGLYEAAPDGVSRELHAVAHPELREHVRPVRLDRLLGDLQGLRDLAVRVGLGDQLDHLELARRERVLEVGPAAV